MKTIFKIHPFFYIFALLCIITGYFKNFLFITFIIIFHEMGHIVASLFFKWRIDKVIILPFGGITIFREFINKPISEEFIIALMGPLFQSLLFVFNNSLFRLYNLYILIFNLLPIIPLDGSKIINLILNKFFSFKTSHIISVIISFIFIIIFLLYKFNLVLYVALLILLIKTKNEFINHKYLFNRFLLERYMFKFHFKKFKIIKSKYDMKRDFSHLFKINNKYYKEEEFLLKLFDKV